MLASCNGDGLKHIKDIDIKLEGMVSSGKDGEFSRFFKTAYLFDFAQEYKMKYLEDKLKRELDFQAKGKFPLRFEEIYDMANYFHHPNRDQTAMDLMIDSIAKGFVKDNVRLKHAYNDELNIWETTMLCDCPEKDGAVNFCYHDDLPEKVAKRVKYFEDPKNAEELNEEFGRTRSVEDIKSGEDGGGLNDNHKGFGEPVGEWSHRGNALENTGKVDEADKENQAPGLDNRDDETNEATENRWDVPTAAGLSNCW